MTDRIAPRYIGLPAIVDGSEAIAHVETRVSELATQADRLACWRILQELAGLRG